MITILILIVKIIGIVLLCLLGIIILLISLVLFVPIRYKAIASKDETICARVKINWLFHFVSATAFYNKESNIIVRILGIPFYDANKREAKAAKEAAHESSGNKRKVLKSIKKESKAAIIEKSDNQPETAIEQHVADQSAVKDATAENTTMDTAAQADRHQTKETLWDKIKQFVAMLRKQCSSVLGKIRNIKYTILRIYDRIKKVIADIRYYIDVIQSEECKKAFGLCKKQLLIIWKHVKPKKYQLYLHIGMEDPSTLGTILAYYGMFYPVYTNHIILQPDFEHVVLEGTAFIKGKITVFVFIKTAWILFFNKNLRRFLALLKKEEL